MDRQVDEVLSKLLAHDALLACDSREDLELILLHKIPEALWAKAEEWSAEQDMTVGEAIGAKHDTTKRDGLGADMLAVIDDAQRRRQRTAYIELARLKACPGTSYLLEKVGA